MPDELPCHRFWWWYYRQCVGCEPVGLGNFVVVADNLTARVLCKEAEHQLVWERPGLRIEVADVVYIDTNLFLYFSHQALLNGFPGLNKAGQGAEHLAWEIGIPRQQHVATFMHQDNDTGSNPRINEAATGLTGAGTLTVVSTHWLPAAATKLVLSLPCQHLLGAPCQRKQRFGHSSKDLEEIAGRKMWRIQPCRRIQLHCEAGLAVPKAKKYLALGGWGEKAQRRSG